MDIFAATMPSDPLALYRTRRLGGVPLHVTGHVTVPPLQTGSTVTIASSVFFLQPQCRLDSGRCPRWRFQASARRRALLAGGRAIPQQTPRCGELFYRRYICSTLTKSGIRIGRIALILRPTLCDASPPRAVFPLPSDPRPASPLRRAPCSSPVADWRYR